ncbi:MAG: plasmid mobilization relaxosome protein MobC [Clostridia bacterium]|nr:plasmid mobilization relaxosome protein MobC [Clostridia bacterium]
MKHLKKKVKKSGLSQETFLRQTVKGCIIQENPTDELKDVLRALSSIGNSVNQLAAKANALGFVDAPMLRQEADKWSKLRLSMREKFLIPEKR